MPSYQITESTTEHVYCLVTLDDGSTFGQMVTGDASKTEAGIEARVREAIDRVTKQTQPREAKVEEAIAAKTVKELTMPAEEAK
jgi:hypothetical protein